jgi:chaperonin GroES
MKVRPLHDRVIVKRVEEEETTKGGIIIPDTAKEKPVEGKIIAVGDGKVADDGKRSRLRSRPEIKFYLGSMPGLRSRLRAKKTSS